MAPMSGPCGLFGLSGGEMRMGEFWSLWLLSGRGVADVRGGKMAIDARVMRRRRGKKGYRDRLAVVVRFVTGGVVNIVSLCFVPSSSSFSSCCLVRDDGLPSPFVVSST
jgi:hypothetical protein